MAPLIALIGRPNVGKSTLFNRLTRSRHALVHDAPGMTRDLRRGEGKWRNIPYLVLDTGGIDTVQGGQIPQLITLAAQRGMEEANALILVVDAQEGPCAQDQAVVAMARRLGKPLLLAVNKSEGRAGRDGLALFHELGISPLVAISAEHGQGIDEMLEAILPGLAADPSTASVPPGEAAGEPIRLAVVGCPNVGKSSLINALIGREQQIVSDQAGTTRDSIDVPFTTKNTQFILVDTAGARRKSRVDERQEEISVSMALKAARMAHVVLLVLDAERGLTRQDKRLAEYVAEAGRGVIIVINKWDLATRGEPYRRNFEEELRYAMPSLTYAPLLFVSAQTGRNLERIPKMVEKVFSTWKHRVETAVLNRFLGEVTTAHPPPRGPLGRAVKLRYITQVDGAPPTFLIFGNRPEELPESYLRFLENRLRESFGFVGTPIRIRTRKGENPYANRPAQANRTARRPAATCRTTCRPGR